MKIINWEGESAVPEVAEGTDGGRIQKCLDLTALHGEREFIRQAFVGDFNGDGKLKIITRTMNANRARCLRISDGETLWVSEDISPPPEASSQISQIYVADIDDDGVAEVILATYQGEIICIDASSGATKWYRRLPWHINNPRLDMKKATPSPGKNIALTVGNDFDWYGPSVRPRINFVRHPSLVVLDCLGNVELLVEDYAPHNGNGHNTWMFDIDDDGLCEIACSGENELLWYRSDGTRLFSLPCKGEEGGRDTHPDDLQVCDWFPERPGKEIVYFDGTDGIIVADSRGEILLSKLFPREIASHLQNLAVFPGTDGMRLLAVNIRSRDSKLLCLDHELNVLWAAQMTNDMAGICTVTPNGSGSPGVIVAGSHGKVLYNPHGIEEASLQIMAADGTPIYRNCWPDETLCVPLAVGNFTATGCQEILVGVGTPGEAEGRFSLADGHQMVLYVFRLPTEQPQRTQSTSQNKSIQPTPNNVAADA